MIPLLVLLAAGNVLCNMAPLMENEDYVPGRYIIQIKPGGSVADIIDSLEENQKSDEASGATHVHVVSMSTVYNMAVIELDYKSLQTVRKNPLVAFVEEDGIVRVHNTTVPSDTAKRTLRAYTPFDTTRWGLDRINQVDIPLDSNSTIISGKGFGVHIYVIDSGVLDTHRDFQCRADRIHDVTGNDGTDCFGHGTLAAGIVAGKTYGVATAAYVHSVRVVDCSGVGKISDIADGIRWVTENHVKPCVVTLSFSTAASQIIDTEIQRLAESGCVPVVSASVDTTAPYDFNACNYSPARSPYAITVAASKANDEKLDSSRYGTCVDIFAPGQYITGPSAAGVDEFTTGSGTSIATSYVAGVAAIHLGNDNELLPSQVRERVLTDATICAIADCGRGTPNRLLYID